MGLLAAQRRRLLWLLMAVLLVPAAAMLATPYQKVSLYENRKLADPPALPRDRAGVQDFPHHVDDFLTDHFGLRDLMVRAGGKITRTVGGRVSRPGAVEGREGFLVLTDGLLRATGQEFDRGRAEDYANFACEAARRLQARGSRLLLAPPPTSVAVYPEAAPEWAGPSRRPTEFDVVLQQARACGVATLDLREALIRQKQPGRRLFRLADSHWTPLAELIAYNRIVEAIGRNEWRIAPAALVWTDKHLQSGDLPRLAGLPQRDEVVLEHDRMKLPSGVVARPMGDLANATAEFMPTLYDSGRPGPSVLIVGDSFTQHPFPPLFAGFAGKVAWIHQHDCAFDWRVMDRVRPDYVLLMPTERELDCGARPKAWDGEG